MAIEKPELLKLLAETSGKTVAELQPVVESALATLGWRTKRQYSPQEIATLGFAIARGAATGLKASSAAPAQKLAQELLPLLEQAEHVLLPRT